MVCFRVQREENKGKRVVLYPAYFDSRLSRSMGRRVPKKLAVKAPTAEEIATVARELGLDAFVEEGHYPRVWWLWKERIVVEKKFFNKTKIIYEIASRLVQRRARRK